MTNWFLSLLSVAVPLLPSSLVSQNPVIYKCGKHYKNVELKAYSCKRLSRLISSCVHNHSFNPQKFHRCNSWGRSIWYNFWNKKTDNGLTFTLLRVGFFFSVTTYHPSTMQIYMQTNVLRFTLSAVVNNLSKCALQLLPGGLLHWVIIHRCLCLLSWPVIFCLLIYEFVCSWQLPLSAFIRNNFTTTN